MPGGAGTVLAACGVAVAFWLATLVATRRSTEPHLPIITHISSVVAWIATDVVIAAHVLQDPVDALGSLTFALGLQIVAALTTLAYLRPQD